MPNGIVIRPNPLNDPATVGVVDVEDDERPIRDAETLYAYMELGPTPLRCNVSRSARAHIESGSMPPDEDVDMWDVVVPGGVPDTVRASNLAIVFPQSQSQDPELMYRVYTITNINQDYLKVIARLTMQLYGVRRRLAVAAWIDPVIEYIVREAHRDMGGSEEYSEKLEVSTHLTDQTPLPCLLWNEGDVVLEHTMEIQGAQVITVFDVQIVGIDRADVGRTLFDFENALLGTADPTKRSPPDVRVAHHNVAGERITQTIMMENNFGDMGDRYMAISKDRPGVREREPGDPPEWPSRIWFPTHQVEQVTVAGHEYFIRWPDPGVARQDDRQGTHLENGRI